MKRKTRNRVKLAAVVAGAALAAAACQGATGDSHPAKRHHVAKCLKVTGKSHVEGTKRWYLQIKGRKDPALVDHSTFKRYGIGDCLPLEEA